MNKNILLAVAVLFTMACVSAQDIQKKDDVLAKCFYAKHSSDAFAVWGYPDDSQKLADGRLYTWNKANPVYSTDLKTGVKTLTRTDHCNIKLMASKDDKIVNFTMDGKAPDGTNNQYSCSTYKRALEKHIETTCGETFNADAIPSQNL